MKRLLAIAAFIFAAKLHALEQVQVIGPVKISTSALSGSSLYISTAIATGWQAATLSAVALPSVTANSVCIRVLSAGTENVYFGPSNVTATTGQELAPGEAWCGSLTNVSNLYIISSVSGSTVAYSALR